MTLEDYIARITTQYRGRFGTTSDSALTIPHHATIAEPELRTFAVPLGHGAKAGWRAHAAVTDSPELFMEGRIVLAADTALTIAVDTGQRPHGGAGAESPWTITGHTKMQAFLTALLEPLVHMQTVARALPADFDLDSAVGAQLDQVGLWIGRTRFVGVPLADTFFKWDTTVPEGWDAGAWQGEFASTEKLVRLNDADYRRLLRGKIATNIWKGDRAGQYHTLEEAFDARGSVLVQDNQDMTQTVLYNTGVLTDVQQAILTKQYVSIKPAGVGINFEPFFVPPFTMGLFRGGTLLDGEIIEAGNFGEQVTFDADNWMIAKAWRPFTAEAVFIAKKEGVAFATITFPAGGVAPVSGVVVMDGDETLIDAADFVQFDAPAVADETGGDLSLSMYGYPLTI